MPFLHFTSFSMDLPHAASLCLQRSLSQLDFVKIDAEARAGKLQGRRSSPSTFQLFAFEEAMEAAVVKGDWAPESRVALKLRPAGQEKHRAASGGTDLQAQPLLRKFKPLLFVERAARVGEAAPHMFCPDALTLAGPNLNC